MVPNGWKIKPLGDLAIAVTSGSRDWAQYYADSGSKFIRMTNLSRDSINLKLDDLKYVDVKSDSSDGKRTSLQAGDILISITAELGKIGWVPDGLGEAYINQHTALVRLQPNHADSKFIAYLLSSTSMNGVINGLNDAGAKAGLNLPTIKNLTLKIPPIPEQRKIAKILSTWEKAITITERLLANRQQQKKALMQRLLTGKQRFAGFEGEWRIVKLKALGKCINGLTYSPSDVTESGLLVLRSSNVQNAKLSFNDNVYVSKKVDNENKTRVGDILICVRNGSKNLIGKTALITEEGAGNTHGAFMTLFRCEYAAYIFQLFQTREYYKQVNQNLGATINSINTSDLYEFKFRMPVCKLEIEKIASVLSAADAEISTIQNQLDNLKQQKKALMQQLLTGKRRVKVDSPALATQ